MPRLDTDNVAASPSNFGFSAERLNELGATEYTLVYIYVDTSASTRKFKDDIEAMVATAVDSCRASPRANNLLVMVIGFSDDLDVLHEPKLLTEIKDGDYTGELRLGTMTCLRDASVDMYERMRQGGGDMVKHDYEVNAIGFIITDGYDTCSKSGPERVKKAAAEIDREECLDSYRAVIISVNNEDAGYKKAMEEYAMSCGFDQTIAIDDASPDSLAKIAGFIASSVSSQSSQLGTGQASAPLTF